MLLGLIKNLGIPYSRWVSCTTKAIRITVEDGLVGITPKQVVLATYFGSSLVVFCMKGDCSLLGMVGSGVEGLGQEIGADLAQ